MRASDATVVIACHDEDNHARILAAHHSAQAAGPAAVVISVDHNPRLGDRLRTALPEATVVDNDGPRRGASPTRNRGAAQATTPVIAFLDDDEVADAEWLERLLEPLADARVVGTGGAYLPDWERGKAPAWFPVELGWAVGAEYPGLPTQTAPVRNVWSGNMAIRREIFEAVAGFDETFGKIGTASRPEDTDLCIRAATVGAGQWMYVPTATIRHHVPARRSTLSFLLRRCYAEGAGKIELRAGVKDVVEDESLGTEARYLTRTVPLGFLRHLCRPGVGWLRAGVLALSVAAAGAGAVGALVRRPRTPADEPAPAEVPTTTATRIPA